MFAAACAWSPEPKNNHAFLPCASVGLDVAFETSEHRADSVARVLRLVLEEDVVLVGEHDEEVPFRARLPLARGESRGLNRDAGRVRRKAERLTFGPATLRFAILR